jgi:hypothetical protein
MPVDQSHTLVESTSPQIWGILGKPFVECYCDDDRGTCFPHKSPRGTALDADPLHANKLLYKLWLHKHFAANVDMFSQAFAMVAKIGG